MTQKKYTTPARILIIRHAEKPHSEDSDELSAEGFERAQALTEIFLKQPDLVVHGTPVAYYASAYIPGKTSNRSQQTLRLLAASYHQALRADYEETEYQKLVKEIMSEPGFHGKTVMIAWNHDYIPQLARAFGANAPAYWPDDVFDKIWIVDFSNNHKNPTFREEKQHLESPEPRKKPTEHTVSLH